MIIGFVSQQDEHLTKGKTLAYSLLFSCGIFVNILLIGAVIIIGGSMMQQFMGVMSYVSFALLTFFGLVLLDVIPMPNFSTGALKARGTGYKGALAVGLFSGLITGPCAFAFVAPILTLAMQMSSEGHSFAAFRLIIAFSLGYAGVICAAGLFSSQFTRWLERNENSKGAFILRQICGIIVILAAAMFLYEA